MTVSARFTESILDMLSPLGRIATRRMFGSVALYSEGLVFALLYKDVLYLKVDQDTRGAFEAEHCGPFNYPLKDGSVQVLDTYHGAPDRLLDEPDELLTWARTAIAAARRIERARAAKTSKPKPAAKPSRLPTRRRTT
jgi:DNA transformation protein and related proteins